MKLFLAAVICTAFLAAVEGAEFTYKKCIRVEVNGTVKLTATNTKTKKVEGTKDIDLNTLKATTNGTCSNETATLTLTFDNATSSELSFKSASNKVTLEQTVTFNPNAMFNSTSLADTVTVSTAQPLSLSPSNASYECDSETSVPLKHEEKGNYTYSVTMDITSMRVQAFGMTNGTFSPSDHCDADQTTVAPSTTTARVPTVKPTPAQTFVVKDAKNVVCFRLEAGLQFVVQYETTDNKTAYSKDMVIPGSANVTGTCAGTGNTATMKISEGDSYTLTITETRSKGAASSAIKLEVMLDPTNFPKAKNANKTMTFELAETFEQSSADTFYVCDSEQELTFPNTSTTLYASKVQLQAFKLDNGSFSGDGVRCSLDPTPSPMPPAKVPGDNTYEVRDGNITCIVLKGEISFSNVTYATKAGSAKSNPIVIPAMNKTTGNVEFSGNCNMEKGNAQQLVITFNSNWTLALTFAKGSDKDSSMLKATAKEFSLRDIIFTYYLTPEFFPNASKPNTKGMAEQTNITTDLMKAAVGGGSYKCDAEQTETLSKGVEFQTTNLQYKAFNTDNSTTFTDSDVTECSADDESNSIVPIAVGAALAGLVVIVLIAYLIGRRRSRRQGYESV